LGSSTPPRATAAIHGRAAARLIFADGTTWNTQQILDHSSYVAAPGSTSVINLDLGDGTLPIEATPGVTLVGLMNRTNTYVWKPGAGNTTINHPGTGLVDTLRLEGVSVTDIQFQDTTYDMLVPRQGHRRDEFPNYALGNGIGRVVFDDGTVLDLFHTVMFGRGGGQVGLHLTPTTTQIRMASDITRSDVFLQVDGSGSLTIKLRGSDDALTISGDLAQTSAGITSLVSSITFDDGSPAIDLTQPLTFTWIGTSTSMNLSGSNFGSNVYETGEGGDTIIFSGMYNGAASTNTVLFGRGDGNASVYLNGTTGTIAFEAGITAQDVYLQTDGYGDLIVKIRNDDADSIMVHNDLTQTSWGVSSGVQQLRFNDGTVVAIGQPSALSGAPLTFTWIGSYGQDLGRKWLWFKYLRRRAGRRQHYVRYRQQRRQWQ
jgi:hypothetical protein